MFDKIKITPDIKIDTNKEKSFQNKRIVFGQKADEFIKSPKIKETNKFQDMIRIFSAYNYSGIANKLLQNNACYLASCSISLNSLQNSKPCVLVQVENPETDSFLIHKYSPDEAKELIRHLKISAVKKSPEKEREYEELYSQVVEKIDKEISKRTS